MAQASVAEKKETKGISSAEDLAALQKEILAGRDPNRPTVIVCHGTGCIANGSPRVAEEFRRVIDEIGFEADVTPLIKKTGCHGFCSRGPLVILHPSEVFYEKVKVKDVEEIVKTSLVAGQPVERLLYHDPKTGEPISRHQDIPFYKLQERVVLKNIGQIDPRDIDDTIAVGGYSALARVLTTMTPDEVIQGIERSGLKGRGGAGFLTGRKWALMAAEVKKRGGPAYVIANGDEGDPGAFMDRTIMEGDPHSVLEGMIIGAYAMGATHGFIYVRLEYPLAITQLTTAIEQARGMGLLGENIMGSGFDFDITINRGAGAFVCGEETALMISIEGKSGEPRPRPPYPAVSGLWGKPTTINNVETWANVPRIINKGVDWFSGIGMPESTGTKVFSLVGKVNNIGLVEVPQGITLGEIVEEIGGGVPGKDRFKSVQIGGPSGGCIPYELKDTPVDFNSLRKIGAMVGSGGLIVMDDQDCIVDISLYFLRFLKEESCGKCIPCRLGIKRLMEFLEKFSKGQGSIEDIEELNSLAQAIKDGALCALGGTSPNPVLTTIRYFREEYEAHILEQRCPAGVCKELITYSIDPDICTGCGLCARNCPQNCISGEKKKAHAIDASACIRCGMCLDSCKFGAVKVQ